LDLDHTILNSVNQDHLSPQEWDQLKAEQAREHKDCPQQAHNCEGLLWHIPHIGMWTKLRPRVREFLRQFSETFQLHICTMGNRGYAEMMAHLLDHDGALFGKRIISRDDMRAKTKDLANLLADEKTLIILDDAERVWPKHQANLLTVGRYHYFRQSAQSFGEPPESACIAHGEEDAELGFLSSVSGPMAAVHEAFFADGSSRDVRQLLAAERSQVLRGVHLLFSGVIDGKMKHPEKQCREWRLAVALGATIETEQNDTVTHLVCVLRGQNKTEKMKWANANSLKIVGVAWIEACYQLWRHMDEGPFHASKPARASSAQDLDKVLAAAGGGVAAPTQAPKTVEGAASEGCAAEEDLQQ